MRKWIAPALVPIWFSSGCGHECPTWNYKIAGVVVSRVGTPLAEAAIRVSLDDRDETSVNGATNGAGEYEAELTYGSSETSCFHSCQGEASHIAISVDRAGRSEQRVFDISELQSTWTDGQKMIRLPPIALR